MTRMKGRHASSNVTALAAAAVGSAMVASLVAFHLGKRSARHDGTLHRDNNTRQQQQRAANDNEVDGQRAEEDPSTIAATGGEESFAFRPIGRVSSIYRLCVGTPRQGLLAPHSRGILELRVHRDSISSLSDYSHLWIVFVFHLNTTGRRSSSKISPPALGGTKKIGLFASRSPHRPNPIGISLCKIDSILPPTTNNNNKKGVVRIRVSGLDLVDGTPILDIKPFVPHYDSVATTTTVNVPTWVSDGLDKRRSVIFSPTSIHQLSTLMHLDKKNGMRFYGTLVDSSIADAISNVRTCIEEVLSVDVRSTWQTGKARRGKFQAEKSLRVKEIITAEPSPHHHNNNDGNKVTETTTTDASNNDDVCTQQLDNLLITYVVRTPSSLPPLLVNDTPPDEAANTNKSGADDSVLVLGIDLIARDMTIVSQQKKSECQSPMTAVEANDETTTVPSSSIQDTLSKLNKVVNTDDDDDDDDDNSDVVQVVNVVENASSAETTADLATKKQNEMMDQDEIGSSIGESLALPSIESASVVVVVAVNGEVAADDNDGLPKKKTKQQATDDPPSSSSSSLHREEFQNKHRQNAASISDIESLVVVHGEVAADDNDSLQMKSKQICDDLPSSSSSLNREGNNHDQNAVSISDTAITSKSSTDKGTFSSLRSYWSSAASKNTPAGIVFPSGEPRRRQSKSNHKFFVFSDKPVRLSSSSNESSFTNAAMEVHESLKVPHGLNDSVMSENGEASVAVDDMSSTRHI